MAISTTYGPNSITTATNYGGGGGVGGGGGGGFGLDAELINAYRRRAREAEADRAIQRGRERQQFDWMKEDRNRALAERPQFGQTDMGQFALQQSAARRQLMENNAATRAPQRELIDSGPGIARGGYLGPDIHRMNAIERNLYAPKETQFGGFVRDQPGSERVDVGGTTQLVSPQEAAATRQIDLARKAYENQDWLARRAETQKRLGFFL